MFFEFEFDCSESKNITSFTFTNYNFSKKSEAVVGLSSTLSSS